MNIVSHLLRYKGFKSILNKLFPNIEILGVWEEFEDIKETYRVSTELIKKYPNLSAIYVTEGTTPEGTAKAINDSNKINKIIIVTHDLTNPTMKYLELGIIKATLSQNPYAQGYDPIIYLYNYLINRKKPSVNRKLTHLEMVNQNNYKEFWNPAQGALISKKTAESLNNPVENTTSKSFKIAVILPDDKLFWEPVAKGAQDATKKLSNYNVTVKCIIPATVRAGGRAADLFISEIDKLLKEGIDALSLPIFDRNLIPYLNQKIDNGLAVTTLNCEPFNFRGIIDNVANHAQSLYKVSENLASGSNETNSATTQINNTMKDILTGTKYQIDKLSESEKGMNILLENIDKIVLQSNESSIAADNTINAAQIGHDTVQKSKESIQELLRSSKLATELINTLNDDAMKIQNIISIIEDISSQTSILAINAAIQAAHAGKEGRGFSVVSTEVSNLAKKSTTATKNIQNLIQTILSGITKATQSITDSMNEVNKSVEISDKVETALNDILSASSKNEDKIQIINTAIKEMKEIIDQFKNSMVSFGKLNRENSTAVETITNSTGEMSQQVQDLNNMANLLYDMAKDQEDLISQFILDVSINK
jgi:methyl-accepting chemotaxis protein